MRSVIILSLVLLFTSALVACESESSTSNADPSDIAATGSDAGINELDGSQSGADGSVGAADTAVDDADADRGSQAAPYRTLKYAINRGQAPVVVLMTGSHEGVGNANVVVAGPSMGKAPVNDGYGSPCHLAVATTLPFDVTPSSDSDLETDGRKKRRTCVGPLIIAGQNNAHLDGTRVSNDAADANVVTAALGPVEKCQRKCAELEHCCNSSPFEGTNEYPSCLQACVLVYDGGWAEDECTSYCQEDRDYDKVFYRRRLFSHDSTYCSYGSGAYQFSFCDYYCSDLPQSQYGYDGQSGSKTYEEAPYTCSTQLGTDERTCADGCAAGASLRQANASGSVGGLLFCEWWLAEDVAEQLHSGLSKSFPSGLELLERSASNAFRYRLQRGEGGPLSLADVFGEVEDAKDALSVATYAVSETTLEQIFNQFAAQQENPENS